MSISQVNSSGISEVPYGNCSDMPNATAELQWFTCTSDGGQIILMIVGTASISDYETILSSVVYTISALEPDKNELIRQIEVSIEMKIFTM